MAEGYVQCISQGLAAGTMQAESRWLDAVMMCAASSRRRKIDKGSVAGLAVAEAR